MSLAPPVLDRPGEAARRPFDLLRVSRIYLEPAVETYPRGREILARFPDAERIEVASHWKIPELHGNAGLAEDWLRVKRDTLVLGVKKGMQLRPNGRSADFIAPFEPEWTLCG